MSEPIIYPSRTDSLGLPLLFAGQAQKEFFINQAMSLVDAVIWHVVEGALDTPPPNPPDGTCYRILDGATGEWSAMEDSLAIRVGGAWQFVSPRRGMQAYDRANQCWYFFDGAWVCAGEPTLPEGGLVVDVEARAAIAQLIDELRKVGLLAPQTP
ncbi:MAG: DUF2793 domain-containing protein [Alphaproteobacteria bacterium]|nr:DUF2793 domain-containing protein [Alphaproteobacteria bacterium]